MLTKIRCCVTLLIGIFSLVSCGGGDADYVENVGSYVGLTGATDVHFTIKNATQETLYVYNYPYEEQIATQSITLAPSETLQLPLLTNPEMRIYFSNTPLTNTIEQGKAPDVFNYYSDATATYSFMEYYYEPLSSRYTIDLSYIDEYSYPITINFTNVPSGYTGCVSGFEYGFSSLAAVKEALKQQTDYQWDALIWPAKVNTVWNSDDYPQNMDRIIGPNKVWPSSGNWVPDSYNAFLTSLPPDGNQLFSDSNTNWGGWQVLSDKSSPSPSDTGYVKALHSVANPDENGKYGFFCYPNDNATGEFTWVPESTSCTITIHPHDK
ncbi:MAG TPA: beta-1,3-glucanase family protein [Geobacteraceae bacterium]|nr:beta-1,3-glucanase family protein [Geobacteraceae bacterium]